MAASSTNSATFTPWAYWLRVPPWPAKKAVAAITVPTSPTAMTTNSKTTPPPSAYRLPPVLLLLQFLHRLKDRVPDNRQRLRADLVQGILRSMPVRHIV